MPIVSAQITPSVLRWARQRSHYEPVDLARRLGVSPERYFRWEEGAGKPTLKQLRLLAETLKQSLSTFYLPEPPREAEALQQLRRLPGAAKGRESPELALQVLEVLELRNVALGLFADLGEQAPTPKTHLATDQDAEVTGARIRAQLNIDIGEQAEWLNPYVALHSWRRALEASGVLVFQMPGITLHEMRGMTIAQTPLPIIGLNSKDAVRARIFTLLHEFCHVLLRDSVLHSTDRPLYQLSARTGTEPFCNAVAAAVLVPKADLEGQPQAVGKTNHADWADEEIRPLARRYLVSNAVILRRLRALDLIAPHCFEYLRRQYDRYEPPPTRTPTGADYYSLKLSRLGTLLPTLAFRAHYSNKITTSDLSAILGVKVKNLGTLELRVSGFNYGFGG